MEQNLSDLDNLKVRSATLGPIPRGREVYNPMAQYWEQSQAGGDKVIAVQIAAGEFPRVDALIRKHAMKQGRGVSVQAHLDEADTQVCSKTNVRKLDPEQLIWVAIQARDKREPKNATETADA